MNPIYIRYYKDSTHVLDSYKIQKRKEIKEICKEVIEDRNFLEFPTRSLNSYVNEWIGHNRLYKLGIKQDHTKDVDLEEPQKIIWRVIWFIIGGI